MSESVRSVRGRSAPWTANLPTNVTRTIERRITDVQEAMHVGIVRERHVSALRALADVTRSLAHEDQRAAALWVIERELGLRGDALDYWYPSPQQVAVLGRLGLDENAPSADDALAELVLAGLEDLVETRNQARSRLGQLEQERDARDLATRQAQETAQRADEARKRAQDELAHVRSELETANRQVATLRASVAGAAEDTATSVEASETAQDAPEKDARGAVKVEPGIKARETRNGIVYDALHKVDGSSRWKKFDTLEEAREFRAQQHREPQELAA